MIDFTPAARDRFEGYLYRLRSSLRGTRSVQPAEVEQSVREHVEVALAGAPQPVGAEHLAAVLEQLGPPERWVSDDEKAVWQRVLNRLQFGPDDWRLAYLAFAMFVVAMLFFPVVGPLLLLPAYVLSRAHVDLMRGREHEMGARRWLVYPAIALVLAFIAGTVLIAPIGGFVGWGIEEHNLHRMFLGEETGPVIVHTRFDIGSMMLGAGVWWIIAAGLIAIFLRPLRFIAAPLLDRLERRHLLGLALVGLVSAVAGALVVWI